METQHSLHNKLQLEKFSIGAPATDLTECIDTCWSLAGTPNCGRYFYEIFPDSSAKLIFRYSSTTSRMVLFGPITEKTTIEIDTSANYFGIRFRAGQVPGIAEVNPAELVNSFVEMKFFRGQGLELLARQLLLINGHEQKQKIMENLIRGCAGILDERCRFATALIDSAGGHLRVNRVAENLGVHIRCLERLFATQMGLSPKKLTRLVRLRHVLKRIFTGEYDNFADLAYTCGYADQSHMIKEFKEMTGSLPSDMGVCEPNRVVGTPETRIVHRYRP